MPITTKVCHWFTTGRWFSSGTPVSSTNNTDRHDMTELLLKVALNTINQPTGLFILAKCSNNKGSFIYENKYRLSHGIFHIIPFISPRSWYQPESRYAQGMIYERRLIKGMVWKMTCYDVFIIYFNRGNNWFVPKCSVVLARIKYMYIAIEQENHCFNIQIQ